MILSIRITEYFVLFEVHSSNVSYHLITFFGVQVLDELTFNVLCELSVFYEMALQILLEFLTIWFGWNGNCFVKTKVSQNSSFFSNQRFEVLFDRFSNIQVLDEPTFNLKFTVSEFTVFHRLGFEIIKEYLTWFDGMRTSLCNDQSMTEHSILFEIKTSCSFCHLFSFITFKL